MEPFHPTRFGGEYNRLAIQGNSVSRPLELLRFQWNGLKHVWEPGNGWPFIGKAHLNDDLVKNTHTVICLRRRNLLRQFVSGHVSRHLGFWVGTRAEFFARLDAAYLPPISIPEAQSALLIASDALQRRDKLLAGLPHKQIILYYEDVFEANQGFDEQLSICEGLLSELQHPLVHNEDFVAGARRLLDPLLYKWANNEVYSRIPGSEKVDEVLGNSVTGRLFV